MANDLNIENEWSYLNAKENNSIPTQNVDINRYVGSHRTQWEYLETHKRNEFSFLNDKEKNLFNGYHRFFKDMIQFKLKNPEINIKDPFNVSILNGNILTYELQTAKKHYFIVANFGGKEKAHWIYFPGETNSWWKEVINSSDTTYGGANKNNLNIISYSGGRSNHIRLGSATFMLYEKEKKGSIKEDLYLRSNIYNWQAAKENILYRASDHGNIFATEVKIPQKQILEFKLATKDWEIELGQSNTVSPIRPGIISNNPLSGALTYQAASPNAKIELDKGTYKFLFNINTFKFNFIKIH